MSIATTALFLIFGERWLADLSDSAWFALMLGWLFGAILVSAAAVVRLGEPFGTLVLPRLLQAQTLIACDECRMP